MLFSFYFSFKLYKRKFSNEIHQTILFCFYFYFFFSSKREWKCSQVFFSLWTRYKEVFNYLCYLLSLCSLQKLERKTLPVLEKVGKVFCIFYAACSFILVWMILCSCCSIIKWSLNDAAPQSDAFFLRTEIEN